MKPVRTEPVTIRKCDRLQNRLLVAIDGGTEFTKVLFLHKRNKERLFNNKEASLVLELSVFHSAHFENAINWLRDNAYIPEDKSYRVHVTGHCTIQQQNKIKSILKRDVLYLDEFVSMAMGCKFALEYIGVGNLLAKPVHVEPYGLTDSDTMRRLTDWWQSKFSINRFPSDAIDSCLFFVQGSNSSLYYFDGKGSCEYFRSANSGISTLLGLSKCLTNINDFKEIIELHSKGNRCNLDTKAKDIIDDVKDSPYGKFSPDIILFPFGKCMDIQKLSPEVLKKEDLISSLIALYVENIVLACTSIADSKVIRKIYICGGVFELELFRKELQKILNVPYVLLRPDSLEFDYSAVLGAMFFEENYIISCNI